MSIVTRAGELVRRHGAAVIVEGGVNFVGPLLIYQFFRLSLGEAGALLASSVPPIVWSLTEFIRRRRIDAISLLVLAGIALSVLAFVGGGSARLLQLREKLVTVLIGVAFLGSAALGRPLIYYLARATLARRGSADLQSFEAMKDNAYFRRAMMVMTVVWGAGLVVEAGVAVVLVLNLSVRDYLIVSPIVGYGTMGGLWLWTFWFIRRQRRKGEARRAAAKAEASGASG
jgi:hypothetical protein